MVEPVVEFYSLGPGPHFSLVATNHTSYSAGGGLTICFVSDAEIASVDGDLTCQRRFPPSSRNQQRTSGLLARLFQAGISGRGPGSGLTGEKNQYLCQRVGKTPNARECSISPSLPVIPVSERLQRQAGLCTYYPLC